jgi:hypothetical protein
MDKDFKDDPTYQQIKEDRLKGAVEYIKEIKGGE